MLEKITTKNKSDYQKYIDSKANCTFAETLEWRDLVEKIYKFRHYCYIFRENGRVTGSLALTLTTHPIMGTYLSTAPFASDGGFHADSADAFGALLYKASEIRLKVNAKYVVIRHLNLNEDFILPVDWYEDRSYATYHLPLKSDPDFFLKKHLHPKERKKINKSINKSKKFGFYMKFGREDLLSDFWYVISRSMKELGSPYHSKHYLKYLINIFKGKAEFAILYDKEGSPACCRLFIKKGNKAFSIHNNSLKKYRLMRANDYFFWLFIRELYHQGINMFDLGRSLIDSGNNVWKMKWRPERYPLSYWYNLRKGEKLPNLNQKNPKLQLLIKTWQILPLWLSKMVGPRLISGIL